jgi:hypothetical protein
MLPMFADSPKQYGQFIIPNLMQEHPDLPQKIFTDKQAVVFKNLNNASTAIVVLL